MILTTQELLKEHFPEGAPGFFIDKEWGAYFRFHGTVVRLDEWHLWGAPERAIIAAVAVHHFVLAGGNLEDAPAWQDEFNSAIKERKK